MDKSPQAGKIRWQSPSNIALIKYWGKYGDQLPKNPSLSFTLKKSFSDTSINYKYIPRQKNISFTLKFEGKINKKFAEKVEKYFQQIKKNFSWLKQYHLNIDTFNTFPHSAGIASSAAFYSSLALCLCSINEVVSNMKYSQDQFYRLASHYARLGSGSASRSVYGGLVLWGKMKNIKASSNQYAIPIRGKGFKKYYNYQDTILIVSSQEKKISSSVGHSLMDNNPYATSRFKDARLELVKLLRAMQKNNLSSFIEIVERDALSLHAMMMTSHPSFMLFAANTINIINEIKAYREKTKANICFTLDAGPNVHVLYPQSQSVKIKKFIKSKLLKYCEDRKYIEDEVGEGPRKIY